MILQPQETNRCHLQLLRRITSAARFGGSFICFLISTSFFVLVSPIVVGVVVVLLVYRWIVRQVVTRIIDPSIRDFVAPIGVIIAATSPYANPVWAMTGPMFLEEPVDKVHIARTIATRLAPPAHVMQQCQYPELRERMVARWGYLFWKQVDNFDPGDHVRYYDVSRVDQEMCLEDIYTIVEDLARQPFDSRRSPWEFVIVTNSFRDAKQPGARSIVIFRGHHCIFDGVSMSLFMSKLSLGEVPMEFRLNTGGFPSLGFWGKIGLYFWSFVVFPYNFVKAALWSDDNMWTRVKPQSEAKEKMLGKGRGTSVVLKESEGFDIEQVKELKRQLGVSMFGLVLTLFLGGFAKLKDARGDTGEEYRMITPLPLPGHQDKLENYFAITPLRAKIFKDNLAKSMSSIEKELANLKSLTGIATIWAFPKVAWLIGSMPLCLQQDPNDMAKSSLVLSCIPGPDKPSDFCGYRVLDLSCVTKPTLNNGIITNVLSYGGKLKFCVFADREHHPVTGHDLEVLISGIEDTLAELVARASAINSLEVVC